MNKKDIITGCSSFNEVNWKDIFYPSDLPRKDWFAYYCRHFKTYEMNGTFYRFPSENSLASWYAKAPPDFLFSVKMYRDITHYKKFRDCTAAVHDFCNTCSIQLREKLACILFQLPPSYSYTEERLRLILGTLDYNFSNVLEFRNGSWWCDAVYKALRERGIVFCNVSYPGLPEKIVATAPAGYIRMHGVPKLFHSGYDSVTITNLQQEVLQHNWTKAFIYFNNTATKEGVLNALEFQRGLF